MVFARVFTQAGPKGDICLLQIIMRRMSHVQTHVDNVLQLANRIVGDIRYAQSALMHRAHYCTQHRRNIGRLTVTTSLPEAPLGEP